MNIVLTRDALSILDRWPPAADYPLGAWGRFNRPGTQEQFWAKVVRTNTGKHVWRDMGEHRAPPQLKAAVLLMK